MRGLLRGIGMKVGDVSRGKLAARIRELVSGHAMLVSLSAQTK
jgi:transposase